MRETDSAAASGTRRPLVRVLVAVAVPAALVLAGCETVSGFSPGSFPAYTNCARSLGTPVTVVTTQVDGQDVVQSLNGSVTAQDVTTDGQPLGITQKTEFVDIHRNQDGTYAGTLRLTSPAPSGALVVESTQHVVSYDAATKAVTGTSTFAGVPGLTEYHWHVAPNLDQSAPYCGRGSATTSPG